MCKYFSPLEVVGGDNETRLQVGEIVNIDARGWGDTLWVG